MAGSSAFAGSSPPKGSQAAQSKQASIPFVDSGSIQDWEADGTDAIYLEDVHNRWYRGTFMGPCLNLPFADVIGIDTTGPDTLDQFATLLVGGERCALRTLVASPPPTNRVRGPHKGAHHKRDNQTR